MEVRSIHRMTREQRRELAHRAAERGDPIHEACPHAPGTVEHDEFHDDYVQHRFALEPERAQTVG